MKQKQTISFQVEQTLVDKLKQEADAKLLSTSALLRLILLEHFGTKEVLR
jgi:hypothetical protein